jgi:hypothetical protein
MDNQTIAGLTGAVSRMTKQRETRVCPETSVQVASAPTQTNNAQEHLHNTQTNLPLIKSEQCNQFNSYIKSSLSNRNMYFQIIQENIPSSSSVGEQWKAWDAFKYDFVQSYKTAPTYASRSLRLHHMHLISHFNTGHNHKKKNVDQSELLARKD